MKKKIVALCLIVALAVTAITGATLAYFTDSKKATNTFTVGNVKIDLTETNWDASGSKDAPEVYPGEALKKNPAVTNTGANPCFVRIQVAGLGSLGDAGMITYETGYQTGVLGADWTLHTDGYFYYTKVLAADEKTSDLFDQIRIPTALENGDGTAYNVVVTAEAVQAQGAMPSWSAVQAMTVDQIAAWFATCMA